MNKLSKFATLVAVVAATVAAPFAYAQQTAAPTAGATAPKFKSIKLSKAQFDELLAHPDEIVVIDVRRPDELTNIGGFPVYLSIQAKALDKSLAFIPKDRKVITVSNHAGRALVAADLLTDRGFKVAGAVGAQDYEAEGGALTKIAPPPPKPATTPAK